MGIAAYAAGRWSTLRVTVSVSTPLPQMARWEHWPSSGGAIHLALLMEHIFDTDGSRGLPHRMNGRVMHRKNVNYRATARFVLMFFTLSPGIPTAPMRGNVAPDVDLHFLRVSRATLSLQVRVS